MELRVVSADGVRAHPVGDLPRLLCGPDLVWLDVPAWDDDAERVLAEQLGLHPRAVRDCASRNPVPEVHRYADHVFVVLHAPERGARGHVHYVELDQFVGPGYVMTVHGPTNPEVPPASALVETDAVLRRLESGRLRPGSPAELSFAIVTALTNRLRDYLTALTEEVWRLERTVTGGHMGDRGRAAGRHRGGHPARHRDLVGDGDERDRLRGDARGHPGRAADRDGGHVGRAVGLGAAQGLVVSPSAGREPRARAQRPREADRT
ncbi:CorA family divalent cation transporter [Pseudonocardia sp.]|uniref:CorA family divalent cation transporter n=1 Tax=Pseudonocardia sp. TaxID=60912 RepID=UPI0031FD64F2